MDHVDTSFFSDEEIAQVLYMQELIRQNEHKEFETSDEYIDPNPDIHALFLQFNKQYFYGTLETIEVRWSSKMTLCAGLCCYEGKGGLCSIRLSEPLLKYRTQKDLIDTLLHEMIHAYLFVTQRIRDHDGHGPEFQKHMDRINKAAGSHITVYHNFTDEVNLYRTHWWQCQGKCKFIVRRAMNRAPSPKDYWWDKHMKECGGEYLKIKEPENYKAKKSKKKDKAEDKSKRKEESDDEVPLQTNKKQKRTESTPVIDLEGEDKSLITSYFKTNKPKIEPKQEDNAKKVACPVCGKEVHEDEINVHIDVCLQ